MPLIPSPDSPKTARPRRGRTGLTILIGVTVLAAGFGAIRYATRSQSANVRAQDAVAPEVYDIATPFDNTGVRVRKSYTMIPSATRPWRIVALFPHMKDSYWVSVDFGMVEQARRLGVSLRILHAGGYENLAVQREQMQACIRSGDTDAIVLGAISFEGLNDLVAEAKHRGIVVVDSVNGVSSHEVSARSIITFKESAREAGRFLARRHPAGSPKVKLAYFPGPEGAGWVMEGLTSFREGIAGSSIEIIEILHGDTGLKAQGDLVVQALDRHKDLAYIVGTAVTAEVAPGLLRERGLEDKIGVVATYINPGVYRQLRRGTVLAAVATGTVDLGRIGLDQAVRVLEKKPGPFHIQPVMRLLEPATLDKFDRSHVMAPDNFEPVFTVNAALDSDKTTR